MSVFIVKVDRELEPEINPHSVTLAVYGNEKRDEKGLIRVYASGDSVDDEKEKHIKTVLTRVREYQSDKVTVFFGDSWVFSSWDGIQVIGRISDGGDITYGVEDIPPTRPLSLDSVDISVPEDEKLPSFVPPPTGDALHSAIEKARMQRDLDQVSLTQQWNDTEVGTPIAFGTRRDSASPVEAEHRNGKRQRDE